MIKKIFLLLTGLLSSFVNFSQNVDDLFISEYVEGSSYNKYLEIFNGTRNTVDLSDYQIHIFSNGNGDLQKPRCNIKLSGLLEYTKVFVVAHSKATLYSGPQLKTGSLNFNGNDAIGLYKISEKKYVDVFGAIGVDPGTKGWNVDGKSTVDATLVRKENIRRGATISENKDNFNTLADEWEAFEKDNVENLGSHSLPGVTGFKTILKEERIAIYPNPVSNKKLFIENGASINSLRIYDFTGREVLSRIKPDYHSLDVSGLQGGIYVLFLELKDGSSQVLKFCVKR
jgi:predicted extracellular nuclease